MTRWFLLLLLAWIVYRLFKRGGASRGGGPAVRPPEAMVVCAHCGVYVPQSESVTANERFFCNDKHRGLWLQTH